MPHVGKVSFIREIICDPGTISEIELTFYKKYRRKNWEVA